MSDVTRIQFRTLLNGKHSELLSTNCARDAIFIESIPDELERSDRQLIGHVAIFTLDQRAIILKSVQAALDRLDAHVYGVCLQCEEPIPEKRLNAIPWASHCVNCQGELDAQPGFRQDDEESM